MPVLIVRYSLSEKGVPGIEAARRLQAPPPAPQAYDVLGDYRLIG